MIEKRNNYLKLTLESLVKYVNSMMHYFTSDSRVNFKLLLRFSIISISFFARSVVAVVVVVVDVVLVQQWSCCSTYRKNDSIVLPITFHCKKS